MDGKILKEDANPLWPSFFLIIEDHAVAIGRVVQEMVVFLLKVFVEKR